MSTLKCTTISKQDGSASVPTDTVVNGSAKAWVNFNGTGTVAIRAAFNVSSITDNGAGEYDVNLTAALSDANYAVVVTPSDANQASSGSMTGSGNPTTASSAEAHVRTVGSTPAGYDASYVSVAIFR